MTKREGTLEKIGEAGALMSYGHAECIYGDGVTMGGSRLWTASSGWTMPNPSLPEQGLRQYCE